jgi:hypothetical protein
MFSHHVVGESMKGRFRWVSSVVSIRLQCLEVPEG